MSAAYAPYQAPIQRLSIDPCHLFLHIDRFRSLLEHPYLDSHSLVSGYSMYIRSPSKSLMDNGSSPLLSESEPTPSIPKSSHQDAFLRFLTLEPTELG